MPGLAGPLAQSWGRQLVAPQLVSHAGALVAFAREAGRGTDRLYFRVLDVPAGTNASTTSIDDVTGAWNGWYTYDLPQAANVQQGNTRRRASARPAELRVAGMDLVTVAPVAVRVDPADADPYVTSDGVYLYVLRTSKHSSLYLDRLVLRSSDVESRGSTRRVYRLEHAAEVRFQRSGLRDVPDTSTDSPSCVDLLGTPFDEPTYELPGVGAGGGFGAARVPAKGTSWAWHIAWVHDGAVHRYAFTQSPTELVDLTGPFRRYTPVVPRLDGVELTPVEGRAPALGWYGELDATSTPSDRTVELPRAGRVVLACPVGGLPGVPAATAVLDCAMDVDGLPPDLSPAEQGVVLVDGTVDGGHFVPDVTSPAFPTPEQARLVTRLVDGLEVSGVLLGQVQPRTDPVLRSGEDGLVHLYVGGPPPDPVPGWGRLQPGVPAAVSAQFDPRVSRTLITVPWEYAEPAEQPAGNVRLLARLSGPLPAGTTVTVSPTTMGTSEQRLADLCDVDVTYAAATGWGGETWTGVPRSVDGFVSVLGGGSNDNPAAPAVAAGQVPFYDIDATRPQARVPLDAPSTTDPDPRTVAHLTVLTGRAGAPMTSVSITRESTGGRCALTVGFRTHEGVPITLVWAGMPLAADVWPAVLEGSFDPLVHPVHAGPGTTAVLGLPTDAYQVDVPVLLLPATPEADLSAVTVHVTPAAAPPAPLDHPDEKANALVDVTFARGDEQFVVTAVPAAVEAFASVVGADERVRALGVVVDATGAAGDVAVSVDPTGPLSPDGWGAFVDVAPAVGSMAGLLVRPGVCPVGVLGRTRRATPPGQDASAARLFGLASSADLPQAGRPAFVSDHTSPVDAPRSNRVVSRTRAQQRAGAPGGPLATAAADDVGGVAHGGVWIRDEPALACAFGEADTMEVPVAVDGAPTPASLDLAAGREWSFETWLRASGSTRRRVVTFSSGKPPVTPDAPTGDYWVDVEGQEVLAFQTFAKTPGMGDGTALSTGTSSKAVMIPTRAFTWELWVQPDAVPRVDGTTHGVLFDVTDPDTGRLPLRLMLDEQRYVIVQFRTGTASSTLTSATPLPAVHGDGEPAWTHVALVAAQDDQGLWSVDLLLDAVVSASVANTRIDAGVPSDHLTIGSHGPHEVSALARLASLRLWSVARTGPELRRTAFVSLSGLEAGLLGCWPLSELVPGGPTGRCAPNAAQLTGPAWDAALRQMKQPVAEEQDDFFLSVVASVGGLDPVEAHAGLAGGLWNHLAVVYKAGGALELNPEERYQDGAYDWAEVTGSDGIVAGPQFAVDAWVRRPAGLGVPSSLLSRWPWEEEPESRSFDLGVDADDLLTLKLVVVTESGAQTHTWTASGRPIKDDLLHHVAWTCDLVQGTTEDNRAATCTVTFFVDGERVGDPVVREIPGNTVQIRTTQADLLIGRTACAPGEVEQAVESIGLWRGLVGRLRVWGTVPSVHELFDERYRSVPRMGPVPGLVAQWDFAEGEGFAAADCVGDHEAVVTSSAPWRSLRATSSIAFAANGRPVAIITPSTAPAHGPNRPQFRLGSPDADGVPGLLGSLAETMVWDEARRTGSIVLQQFTPRAGDEPALVAGWDFSLGGMDITGGGNDASPPLAAGRVSASDAPVASEAPAFRNVYGGVVTTFNESAPGRVGVGTGTFVTGMGTENVRAVLVRHALLDPSSPAFVNPVEVGELDLVYIGQVQSEPTLVGYIEGAPPVPSENLARPYYLSAASTLYTAYSGTSAVTLVQDAAQAVRYTSTSRGVTDVSAAAAFGFLGLKSHEALTTFMTYTTSAFSLKTVIQLTGVFKTQVGEREVQNRIGTWARGQRDTVALQGDWEPHQSDPSRYLVPAIGRRYQPANLGHALVESLTADMYATIYRRTGAATGTIVVPNPAIPPDRNILVFPMDDRYTKAGTLDGKVGFANDPSWPQADAVRGSYFRPAEAYGFARMIELENARLQAYAESFDAVGRGRLAQKDISEASSSLPIDFSTSPKDSVLIGSPRVGLVNRYVWHADNGLHVETQAASASTTSTFSGWLDYGGGGGIKGSGEFFAKIGFAWGFDVSATHTVGIEVLKDSTQTQSVSLDVQVTGERFLRAWSPTAPSEQGTGTGAFLPGPAPGKVRAYRFMTIFMPPSKREARAFTGIVDPTWKMLSTDPAARALRDVDASGPVWRVLHRVTYVERVPPLVSTTPVLSASTPDEPPVNVAGNTALLTLIADRIHVPQPTSTDVGRAVAEVLNPAPNPDGGYPAAVLEAVVPWWRAFLDRARPVPGVTADPEAAALLRRIVTATVDYVLADLRARDEG